MLGYSLWARPLQLDACGSFFITTAVAEVSFNSVLKVPLTARTMEDVGVPDYLEVTLAGSGCGV